MSILIKGMDMPEKGTSVFLCVESDGKVFKLNEDSGIYFNFGTKAVKVPTPHGKLIDADRIQCVPYLTQEPTVIEAEE